MQSVWPSPSAAAEVPSTRCGPLPVGSEPSGGECFRTPEAPPGGFPQRRERARIFRKYFIRAIIRPDCQWRPRFADEARRGAQLPYRTVRCRALASLSCADMLSLSLLVYFFSSPGPSRPARDDAWALARAAAMVLLSGADESLVSRSMSSLLLMWRRTSELTTAARRRGMKTVCWALFVMQKWQNHGLLFAGR